jgi:hypothetical protein
MQAPRHTRPRPAAKAQRQGRAAIAGRCAATGAVPGALTGRRGVPQVQAAGINPATIQRVLLTHLHGDHCFGAPGLLAAISTARAGGPLAAEPLLVVGPPGLSALLRSALGFGAAPLTMPVLVVELTVDPAASHAPAPMEGLGLGSGAGVHVARLGPDQPAVAEAALARMRGARGPGARGRGGTRRAMRDEHSVRPAAARPRLRPGLAACAAQRAQHVRARGRMSCPVDVAAHAWTCDRHTCVEAMHPRTRMLQLCARADAPRAGTKQAGPHAVTACGGCRRQLADMLTR